MIRPSHLMVAMAAAALGLTGCGGSPPPRPAPVAPSPVPAEPVPAAAPATTTPPVLTHFGKLDNGLTVSITQARAGAEAQLQLGFDTGAAAVAHGLAELGAHALVTGAEASQGRMSLEHVVRSLGGIVRIEVGTATTWIDIRVPGGRWQEAQAALLAALTAPPQPRGQLERLREQLVQTRSAAIEADPTAAMARALLLAESDTAAYVTGLLDRDASEVGLFLGRHFRPERAVLALHVPGDPTTNAAAIARPTAGSLARWNPPAIAAGTPPTAARRFPTGIHWSPNPAKRPSRIALVLCRADLLDSRSAELATLMACLTLDGAGGRLERMQVQNGLAGLRWQTSLVHTADHSALVLQTTAPAQDAAKIWQTFTAARLSLRDVPPTNSEIELAARRARLSVGLGQMDNLARLRVQTMLRRKAPMAEPFVGLARPGTPEFLSAIDAFLDLPFAMVVLDGDIPMDLPDVHRFDVLPPGMRTANQTPTSSPAATMTPWMDRACEAAGGVALVRRLTGCESEGRLQTEGAPTATETVAWQTSGLLVRSREVLGTRIDTVLDANVQAERIDAELQTLDPKQSAMLRREFERHPVALLAAHANGTLRFQPVAQRTVGDRDLMILQAQGDRFDRLRVHLDTGSHLIRVVEVWESMPDGTTVHLQDAWSDYRTTGGLRVPFRRVTTQDEGQNRVETVFTKWQPVLKAP